MGIAQSELLSGDRRSIAEKSIDYIDAMTDVITPSIEWIEAWRERQKTDTVTFIDLEGMTHNTVPFRHRCIVEKLVEMKLIRKVEWPGADEIMNDKQFNRSFTRAVKHYFKKVVDIPEMIEYYDWLRAQPFPDDTYKAGAMATCVSEMYNAGHMFGGILSGIHPNQVATVQGYLKKYGFPPDIPIYAWPDTTKIPESVEAVKFAGAIGLRNKLPGCNIVIADDGARLIAEFKRVNLDNIYGVTFEGPFTDMRMVKHPSYNLQHTSWETMSEWHTQFREDRRREGLQQF